MSTRPQQPHGDPLDEPPTDPDPLDAHVAGAGQWGIPGPDGYAGQSPAMFRPPVPTDTRYAQGITTGPLTGVDDAISDWPPQHLLGAVTDAPRSYELPHEATHRRYEPIQRTIVAQAAAGFSLIASPNQGLHYIKVIACCLTLDAAGTIKFVQGPEGTATGSADMSGAMAVGGAAAPPLLLPPAELANPWLLTAPDLALGIVTATGKAAGWIMWCYSPYDS
jgi:hypothetical protein